MVVTDSRSAQQYLGLPVAVSPGNTDHDDVAFGHRSSDSLVATGIGSGAIDFGHVGSCAVRVPSISNGDFVAGKSTSIYRCHSLGLAVVRLGWRQKRQVASRHVGFGVTLLKLVCFQVTATRRYPDQQMARVYRDIC